MSLDQDIQIRDLQDLVGHTIKAVIEQTVGKREADVVIVTETGCYLVLNAEGGTYDEEPTIEVEPSFYGGSDIPLGDYISAGEAFHSGLINQTVYEYLRAKEIEEAEAQKKKKADQLRKMLAELEGGAS